MDINSHVEGNNSSHSLKVQVLNERDTQAHIRKKKKKAYEANLFTTPLS